MKEKINDLNINYIIKGEGKPILLLHGWGVSFKTYTNLINHLSKNNKVYALDMPGFGLSDEPNQSWEVSNYVDFIISFIKKFNLDNITLIGHSFGGRVIIKLFSKKLDFNIDKVILIDSAGIKHETTSKKEKVYKAVKKVVFNKVTNKIFPNLLDKIKNKVGSADYKNASPLMKQTLVKVINEDLTSYLKNITSPVLLIWGTLDEDTPIEDAYIMEKNIPNAGIVKVENASHYSFLEQPYLVYKVIDTFLGGK